MDLMHVEQPLTGSVWAIGVVAFWLIVCATPVASVSLVLSELTRRYGYQWQPAWRLMFQAGFVVQLCSLLATVAMWLMLLVLPGRLEGTGWWAAILIISVSIVGGCFGLGAWRGLMAAAVPESPPSILC
jgi:hypothetical protein